ncbi:MAG: hypothetical protein MI976_29285 [Pseudomonadales bacterium]|nr:hypothetical protein [Pseudomonadales bacterium]
MKHRHSLILFLFSIASALSQINLSVAASSTSESDAWSDAWGEFEEPVEDDPSPLSITGFVEAAIGARVDNDPAIRNDLTLGEIRNRWNFFYNGNGFNATYKADLYHDDIDDSNNYHTREANLFYRINRWSEIKMGRQILTWGTGDLLFLNDLFPKDWQSLFAGRDTRYLKAPSDAMKLSLFSDAVNIDLVYTPEFDQDNFIKGQRFSYYSAASNNTLGEKNQITPLPRTDSFIEDEIAIRFSKNLNGDEYALYFYEGYYKNPIGIDTSLLRPYFPELRSVGASYRATAFSGIFNSEVSFYQSKEDKKGTDPYIPNDELRFLIGFEKEAMTDLTLSFQYYLEWTQDYPQLIENSPTPTLEDREYRSVITNRITYRTNNGNLNYSLFGFYSASDKDSYFRPAVDYRYSDALHLALGGNFFAGKEKHTFFSQFENNSNIYTRIRYYF